MLYRQFLSFGIVFDEVFIWPIIVGLLTILIKVWRCYVVWSTADIRTNILRLISVAPTALLVASLGEYPMHLLSFLDKRIAVFGIIFGIKISITSTGFFDGSTYNFALTFFTTSLGLNVLLTLLIGGRIWAHVLFVLHSSRSSERRIEKNVGDMNVSLLANVKMIFVESAVLYVIPGTLLVGTYAARSPISQIWFAATPATQVSISFHSNS